MLNNALIERLEALKSKSTAGIWSTGGYCEQNYLYGGEQHLACISSSTDNGLGGDSFFLSEGSESAANAALIVELINNFPVIIAALKARDTTNA